ALSPRAPAGPRGLRPAVRGEGEDQALTDLKVPVRFEHQGVTVDFGVVQEKEEVYTAKLTVTAGEKVTGLALSLPVGGEVDSVTGAGWQQDGDTLVLEPDRDLEVGESLVLTFTAHGRAQAPRTCRSTRGECAVV
ncbi:hypothetical protein, partial [Streptosporangium minutum]